ncbi:MAG: signal peptidase I [Bacillota bacterium]
MRNIISLTLVVLSVFFICLMMQNKNGGDSPGFGDYKLMIVMSGSMQPAFDTGSLIIVKKVDPEIINQGDIITFLDGENSGHRLITHRVMEVIEKQEGNFFITKGDANSTRDFSPVPEQNVVGKVTIAIPYLGYLIGFSGFKTGVLIFLIIALLWAIMGEFRAARQILGREHGAFKADK